MNHFKQIAAQAALAALFAGSASAASLREMMNIARNDPNAELVCNFSGCTLVYTYDDEEETVDETVDETVVVEFNDEDAINMSLEVGASVTYEFQSLQYDNCDHTYILAESDSDLYTFGNFQVQQITSDEGTIQWVFTGTSASTNDISVNFYN